MARGGRPRTTKKRFTTIPPRQRRKPKFGKTIANKPKFIKVVAGARAKTKVVTFRPTGKRGKSGEGITFSRGARGKIKARPTRVTVASPSGKGKTITVSSRSRLARKTSKTIIVSTRSRLARKTRKPRTKTKARGRKVPTKPRRTFGSDFDIFRVGATARPRAIRKGARGGTRSKVRGRIRTFDNIAGIGDRQLLSQRKSLLESSERRFRKGKGSARQGFQARRQRVIRQRAIREEPDRQVVRRGSDFDVLNFFA